MRKRRTFVRRFLRCIFHQHILSCHATVDFSALSAKQMYSCYITAARASISSHHTSNTLLAVGSASAKCASKCCLFKR